MLPFSSSASRWAWWDVYMPDNDRRRALQSELESSPLFQDAIGWQNRPLCEWGRKSLEKELLASSNGFLVEAIEVMRSFPCARHLGPYLEAVSSENDVLPMTGVA